MLDFESVYPNGLLDVTSVHQCVIQKAWGQDERPGLRASDQHSRPGFSTKEPMGP